MCIPCDVNFNFSFPLIVVFSGPSPTVFLNKSSHVPLEDFTALADTHLTHFHCVYEGVLVNTFFGCIIQTCEKNSYVISFAFSFVSFTSCIVCDRYLFIKKFLRNANKSNYLVVNPSCLLTDFNKSTNIKKLLLIIHCLFSLLLIYIIDNLWK